MKELNLMLLYLNIIDHSSLRLVKGNFKPSSFNALLNQNHISSNPFWRRTTKLFLSQISKSSIISLIIFKSIGKILKNEL